MMRRESYATLSGLLLLLGGLAIMVGWLGKWPIWDSVFPGTTATVFNTALCFALAGIAVAARSLGGESAARVRMILGCAIGVVAGLSLLENIFSVDLGVDWHEQHRWFLDQNPIPGRMAPNTAFALLMGGAALTLDYTRADIRALRYAIPVAMLTTGILGIIASTLLLDLAYSWFVFPRMAFSTGIGVVLFGIALLLEAGSYSGTESGPRNDPWIYTFMGMAATILLTIAVVSYGSINALIVRERWVEHTHRVRLTFEEMIALDERAHIVWRDYLLARDPEDKRKFHRLVDAMNDRRAILMQLTRDKPLQQARLHVIGGLIEREFADLNDAMRQVELGRVKGAEKIIARLPVAKAARAPLDAAAVEFRDQENALLAQRQQESQQSSAAAVWTIDAGNALGLVILLYAFWILKRQNTKRNLLERMLQAANEELADLYNKAPCGYHSTDRDGTIVRMNDTELDWLGYAREEVIGRMSLRDIDAAGRTLADFGESGRVHDRETEYRRRDGSTFSVLFSAAAVYDQDGKLIMSHSAVHDITKRKLAEREIKNLNTSLQMHAAQLEAANKELESFVYSVSHDLRAPLRAIDGYAQMLEEDCLDALNDEGRRYLAQVRGQSKRMGDLIDDLLHLSRLGRQAINLIELNMDGLVRKILDEELHNHQGKAPCIDLAELPPAKADPVLMHQVWANLISNALKYSGKTENPEIRISGRRTRDEIIYSIRDNGAGFDMAYYGKLFGVFQRLHGMDEFSGTGVGLAIVHRAVARHGGRVWAKAEVNRGAEFHFTLPTGEADGYI